MKQFQFPIVPGIEGLFDNAYDLRYTDVKQLDTKEAMYLRRSDVILVRSKALPMLGDHYAIVTGWSIQKEHGLRPQMMVFPAMQDGPLLDLFDSGNENVIILKLGNEATQAFMNHYELSLDVITHEVVFYDQTSMAEYV